MAWYGVRWVEGGSQWRSSTFPTSTPPPPATSTPPLLILWSGVGDDDDHIGSGTRTSHPLTTFTAPMMMKPMMMVTSMMMRALRMSFIVGHFRYGPLANI